MARKSGGSLSTTITNLSRAIDDVLGEITQEMYECVDRGLDKAARHMKQALESETPVDTGATRAAWEAEFKYKNVRYINNTRVNKNGVPVVNLLEFGRKGKPFVRKTVQAEQENVIRIIKEEIERG